MRIKYSVRSDFLEPAKQLLLADRDSLNAGNAVRLDFGGDYEYREDDFLLSVSSDDPETFLTDWWKAQSSLFPGRAKAAATALRDLGLFGSYEFSNRNQGLEITRFEHTDSPLVSSHSWDTLSEEVADKKMDRSAFLHHGTGVPADITWFFGITESGPEFPEVSLVFNGRTFAAKIPLDNEGRYRLFWQSDFANALGEALPNCLALHQQELKPNQDVWMRFEKTSAATYEVKLCTERGDESVRGVAGEKKGESGRLPITGYWTFISNPKYWPEIFEILEGDLEVCGNKVRYADAPFIGPGQLGVVRITTDQRSAAQRKGDVKREAGVYAVVEITSDPYLRQQTEVNQGKDYGVDYRFIKKLASTPLTIDDLRENEDITDKYVLNPIQASSIPLNKETFDALVKLADAEADLDLGLEKSVAETPKRDLAKKFRKASPKLVERISKRYERGSEGEKVKKRAGRKCQINEAMGLDPYSFKKSNGEHYCEAHHVVPVSSGEEGTLHPSNVICVSADRHRQLHYGDVELVEIREDEFEFLIDGETVNVPKLVREE